MANKIAAPDRPDSLNDPQMDEPATFDTILVFNYENGRRLQEPRRHEATITLSLAKAFVRASQSSAGGSKGGPPLSFSSLLVAMLVDEGGWLQAHFEGQAVLFDEIKAHRYYDVQSLQSQNESQLEPAYDTTPSAQAALEEAIRIARLASGETTIDLRHLCAAYPVLSRWHVEDFQKFNIDRLEWARSFGAEMAQRFPKERRYWGSYADRASPVPLTSFSADVYTEEDLLGIDRGVDALALLIASTHTVTPLAIGVFGPWGSGKTFFMRHLQKRIVGLRRDEQPRIQAWVSKRDGMSAQPADAPLYFGQIAQVEFNAWHYNEGNLVASLVEHLFRNLRVLPDEGDEELAKRRADMLRQLNVLHGNLSTVDQTIDAAEKKVAEAKAGVDEASQATERAREGVRDKAVEIEAQNKALAVERKRLDEDILALELKPNEFDPEAAIAVALGPLAPLLTQMRETYKAARDSAFDWKAFGERVISAKGLMVIALCIAAPLFFWLTKALEAQWAALMGSVAAAFGGFRGAIEVIKQQRARFQSKLVELEDEEKKRVAEARAAIQSQRDAITQQAQDQLKELAQTLDSRRRQLATQEARLAEMAQELATRVRDHDERLAERTRAEQRVRDAEADLKRLSSALLLEEFIKDRLATDEYRKQLGFLALVRRDIERLSQLIDQANKNWLRADNSDAPPLLNRIVLYIDDLDRCKESTVLAVLEAVHLLLAFPLFVCAVAVDPRWVEKCLRAANRQLFFDGDPRPDQGAVEVPGARPSRPPKPDAMVTVGDYLEKIFQIPIWMAPIESRTRAVLVNSLLGPTASPVARGRRNAAGDPAPPHDPAASNEEPQADAFKTLVAKARETPDPLRISPQEAAYIDEIAEILSDRPRALKRLVNIYRLLKASLPDIERASFAADTPSSAYRICLTQLAIFTSHPRLAPALVAAVGKASNDEQPEVQAGAAAGGLTLEEWVNELGAVRGSDVDMAFDLIPNRDKLLFEPFRAWLPQTSRYLFHRED